MAGRTLCLSGWGQPPDALASLLPAATHVDYGAYTDVFSALAAIARAARDHDVIVGWSLGGQLAVRAVAAGLIRPRALVLIAAPYQFVAHKTLAVGMKRDQYEKFCHNYQRNPARTLDKGWGLIAKDDSRSDTVRGYMAGFDKQEVLAKDWLGWLQRLEDFSCVGLHLADFPPTLLIHGKNDAVASFEQSQCFARAIPHAKLHLWPGCGHAPHWHDEAACHSLIESHLHV